MVLSLVPGGTKTADVVFTDEGCVVPGHGFCQAEEVSIALFRRTGGHQPVQVRDFILLAVGARSHPMSGVASGVHDTEIIGEDKIDVGMRECTWADGTVQDGVRGVSN